MTLPQAKVKGSTLTPVIGPPMATDADRTEQTPSSFSPLTALPNPDLNTGSGGETIGPGLGSTSSPSRPSRLPRIWSDMKERLSGWFSPGLGTGIRLVEEEEEEGEEEEEEEGEERERLNVGEEAV